MRSVITIAAFSAVACAFKNYTVDPSTIDATQRATWCNSQFNTCNTLCNAGGGGTKVDTCDSETLKYECLCKNGTAPGLAYYINSMDTLLCKERFGLCIDDTAGDSAGQTACNTNINETCGTLIPEEAKAPAETSAATSDSPSQTTGSSDTSETAKSDAVLVNIHQYGNAAGAVAIGLLAYML